MAVRTGAESKTPHMGASGKENFGALFQQAVEHHVHGRVYEALLAYDAIIRDHPAAAAAHCNRGLALQSLNQPEAALQSYDRAISLDPRYADAHYNRGILLRDLQRLSEAVESYGRAIRYNAEHVQAWSNRGNALRALGRTEEALENFDRAIALRPDVADTHYNR